MNVPCLTPRTSYTSRPPAKLHTTGCSTKEVLNLDIISSVAHTRRTFDEDALWHQLQIDINRAAKLAQSAPPEIPPGPIFRPIQMDGGIEYILKPQTSKAAATPSKKRKAPPDERDDTSSGDPTATPFPDTQLSAYMLSQIRAGIGRRALSVDPIVKNAGLPFSKVRQFIDSRRAYTGVIREALPGRSAPTYDRVPVVLDVPMRVKDLDPMSVALVCRLHAAGQSPNTIIKNVGFGPVTISRVAAKIIGDRVINRQA